MNRFAKKFGMLSAAAATLFLWGCENVGTTTQPALEPEPMVVMSTTGQRYVVAMEILPTTGSVTANIGTGGGVLVLGRHSLWVSPGAVDSVTTFKMTRDADNPLRVHLTASRNSENDIGSQGFKAPVKLGMSWWGISQTPADLNSMKIAYFRPDGLVEVLGSWVQVGNYLVMTELEHFSVYGLVWGDMP